MSALSKELRARARWAGLFTARRLLRDGARWLKAAGDPASVRPPTVRVEIARRLEPGQARPFAEEMLAGALVPRLAPHALDGRLWVVDDEAWAVWQGASLKDAQTGIGEMRSEGAVVVVLGAHAGQTLDAVGETLDASLPPTAEVMLRRSVVDGANAPETELAERCLGWAWDALGARPDWLLDPCLESDPAWWNVKPSRAWWALVESVWPRAGGAGMPTQPVKQTRTAIRAALSGTSAGSGSATGRAGTTPTVEAWLKAAGEDVEALNDGGLETIFKGTHWASSAAARDVFLRARIAAVKATRKLFPDATRTDFERLAPLPALGPKREPTNIAPGVPVLDAVWIVRALLAAFPGEIAGVGASLPGGKAPYLTVARVTLRMKPELAPGAPECVLFPPGQSGDHALREVGREVVRYARGAKPQATEGVYEVALRCTVNDVAHPSPPVEIVAEFPWRWAAAPSFGDRRASAVKADFACFAEVRQKLEKLKDGAYQSLPHVAEALHALGELDARWKVFRARCDEEEAAEHGGVHVVRGGLWAPAEEYLDAYLAACESLVELFKGAGNLAPRVADGPLERFLRFGLCDEGEDGWRLFGYHPLRLARLADVEREALLEVEESIRRGGALRDVPLVALPPLDGAPAVLWSAGRTGGAAGAEAFLVPSGAGGAEREPWSERYVRHGDTSDTEPDLVEPLRPVLTALAALFPGVSRRASVLLDGASRTDRGARPLLLMADAVKEGGPSRLRVTHGVDLHAPDGMVTAHLATDDVAERLEADRLATILEAMTEVRADDAHFPLEVHVDNDPMRRHHLALLVRPSLDQTVWATRPMPETAAEAAAMVWEPDALAWSQVKVPGVPTASAGLRGARYEQLFQRLVVLRWRREADAMERCLGLSLEASPEHPRGAALADAIVRCAERSARVVVADRVYGAEAVDAGALGADLRVTYADYRREEAWRITVIARRDKAPERERETVRRGLARLYGCDEDRIQRLSEVVYEATHRAVPAVFRALCRAGGDRESSVDAELVGHLGVALLSSPDRGRCTLPAGTAWPAGWDAWGKPQPEGTLLLSMDSLQRWTWTRRSGVRGDFIAMVPGDGAVTVAAVESKGSEGEGAADGTAQAAVAAGKLRERFSARERWQERRELLRCVAEEAFRAPRRQRAVYDAVAKAEEIAPGRFVAVCVSTAVKGSGLGVRIAKPHGDDVLWIDVRGVEGLKALAGVT